jgi:uncharacterized protein
MFDKKINSMEQETQKIVDNYEMRLAQLSRKNDKEVESLRIGETERKIKEDQAQKIAHDVELNQHMAEMQNLRDKYEHLISRDRTLTEQNLNKLVQKYDDQIERERFDHQRELQSRLTEAQSSIERLFKQSETEKDTMRKQYEDRMEMMKLAQSERENTKKA